MASATCRVSDAEAAAARSLAVDIATADVLPALGEAGVRALVLKGPSFAAWLYPDGTRTYGDLDVLVAPEDVTRAGGVLTALGFRAPLEGASANEVSAHHELWVRAGSAVEVHRTFHDVAAAPEAFWDEMSRETESMRLPGTIAEAPAEPARCLLAALHAGADVTGKAKPLRDLTRAVELAPEATWVAASAMAGRLDAGEAFAFGLSRVPPGEQLARRLGLDVPRTGAFALRAADAPTASYTIDRLAHSDGFRATVGLVLRKLAPTRDYMAYKYGPRRGQMLRGYLARPFDMARRAGPAWLAWRRAQR